MHKPSRLLLYQPNTFVILAKAGIQLHAQDFWGMPVLIQNGFPPARE